MKIPLLHSLEKKIRHRLKKNPVDPRSKAYRKRFQVFLSEKDYPQKRPDEKFILTHLASAPLVSIIIPCFNQFEFTIKCINSISINTESSIPYEIILIDDNSSDDTSNIEDYYPEIRVIRNKENQGFLKNVNNAAKQARGEYIVLLNNDTIVLKEWLSTSLHVFEHFDHVGAVGSKLIYPNGMLQEAGGYITKDEHFGNCGKFKSIFLPSYNYTREVDYVSGACFLIKKQLWSDLGGFDDIYLPAYFEDTDLCMRIRATGRKVMYNPLSCVLHFESISYGTSPSSKKEQQMEKNKSKFIERWKEELEKSHLSMKDSEKRNYERTGKNPTILYIDQEPPNDYACGSKLSKLYCNLLSEMGFHVKYLPMHVSKSNQKYIQDLEVKGIECYVIETSKGRLTTLDPWVGPLSQTSFETWFKSKSEVFDYYLLARPSSYKYLNIIQTYQPDAKYFYHPADLHFLRMEREKLFSKKHQINVTESTHAEEKQKMIELSMLKNAQKVLHVSTYEDNYLKKEYGINNGTIIPCLFFDSENKRNDNSIRKELMYVGSNHHASTDGINWFLDEIFPSILDMHPDVVINITGSCGTKISQNKNIKTLGRVSDDELKQLYQTCIAIIPLRYGAGVKGKVLEAMNYRTPFVSTNIGLEGIKGINRAKKGIDTPKEFACEVCKTLTDSRYQDTDIKRCYEVILQNYTRKSAQTTLESIFN